MKIFSLKKRESSHRRSKALWLGTTLFAAALLIVFLGRGVIGGALAGVTEPLYTMRALTIQSAAQFPSYFRDRGVLIDRIASLEEENARLRSRVMAEDGDAERKAGTMTVGGVFEERIVAGVLARPPFLPYDAVLLDRGSEDGVREGAVLYVSEEEAVGTIARTFRGSSLAALFSTPGIETSVYVIGPDIYTQAYGEGNGIVRVSVPQGVSIGEGDTVVLPGLSGGVLGTFDVIRSEPTEPEQSGFISLQPSVQSLRFVSISTYVPGQISFEEAEAHIKAIKETLFFVPVPEDFVNGQATTTSVEVSTTTDDDTSDLFTP